MAAPEGADGARWGSWSDLDADGDSRELGAGQAVGCRDRGHAAGYTIPAHLRSALDVRDRKCIVPGCDAYRRLEKDHRNTFSRTGITKLDDLAHLCPWHHYLKTFLGYTYRGGPGTWEWIPPENRDVDLSALKRVITCARRC
jgi:hypothetical protein